MGTEMTPGPGRVRIAVKTESEGPILRPPGECGEPHPGRIEPELGRLAQQLFDAHPLHHRSMLCKRSFILIHEVVMTDEQKDFAEAIRDFAQRECGTRERRLELTEGGKDTHSPELHKKMAELGWLGVAIPEEYGGSGGSLVDQCVFFEELNRGMVPVSGIGPSSTVAGCYKRFGTEEQKKSALGGISEGKVFSISISEPEAGSDVSNVSCKAVGDDNGGYLINGQKTWCTAAHVAGAFLVLVRTSREEKPHDGLTLIEVLGDAEG